MAIEVGRVEAIYRYPVKSMRGEPLETAALGWHGLEGDRRLAFLRLEASGGFPWLTASKLPDLVRFTPVRRDGGELPTHIRTPEGEEMEAFGEALATELGRRFGGPVRMMHLKDGIFHDANLSVITTGTVSELCRLAGQDGEARRFRPNVVVRSVSPAPFAEDEWLGGTLTFGEGEDAPAVSATIHDLRCVMVNIDPSSASTKSDVLKAAARANRGNAGIYGTITRIGRLAVGQPVFLTR